MNNVIKTGTNTSYYDTHSTSTQHYQPVVVYPMKATCDGLPCPPYNTNMALLCAVCSK